MNSLKHPRRRGPVKALPKIGNNQGRLDPGCVAASRMSLGLSPHPGDPRATQALVSVCAVVLTLLLLVVSHDLLFEGDPTATWIAHAPAAATAAASSQQAPTVPASILRFLRPAKRES